MTYTYVPKSERGKPNPPTFTLRDLAIRDMAQLEDEMVEHDQQGRLVAKIGTSKLRKFLLSLTGWERVQVDGVDLAFSEEAKYQIPPRWYNELVDAINARLEVGASQEGE